MLNLNLTILTIFTINIFVSIIGFTLSREKMMLYSLVVLLLLVNNPIVTSELKLFGIGPPAFVYIYVGFCIIGFYRVNIFSMPRYLFSVPGFLLVLAVVATFLSLFNAISFLRSVKAFLSLVVIVTIGWFFVGITVREADRVRVAETVLNAFCGTNAALSILVLVTVGPFLLFLNSESNGTSFHFLGYTFYRLQTFGFNATGVGIHSAIGLFWAAGNFRSVGQSSEIYFGF